GHAPLRARHVVDAVLARREAACRPPAGGRQIVQRPHPLGRDHRARDRERRGKEANAHQRAGFSLAIQYSSATRAAYGSMERRSEAPPSKNGLWAADQAVIALSKSPSTPAVKAMSMPASAPPAM